MLKKNNPLMIAHQDALQRSLRFLLQRPLSTLMTLLVIAVTLMLASLCWMATSHVSEFKTNWQHDSHISLYLKDNLSPNEQQAFLTQILSMPGVDKASLTSAADGLVLLSEQEGMQDIADYLPQNPLPAVIDVTPDASLTTPQAVEQFYQSLKILSAVEDAKLDIDWISRLYSVLGFLTQLMQFLMVVLAIAVMLVIGNTLRLIIYHRQEEIQVLQLLGATSSYIMRPFLYSGIWYGFLAACVTIVLVDTFILMLRSGLNQWAELYQMHFSLTMMSGSLILGVIFSAITLGWFAARFTVQRYL